ncbi:hypothetical protein QVD17_33392 [Tagetes erecta]|uniref:Cell wall protein n=1 Tax=Tagetes erecta TaxID=13708 RepID=A0AAD8NL30_TARER|nr:hypothetical protein QVD17_33392 [Tagetes erecta]
MVKRSEWLRGSINEMDIDVELQVFSSITQLKLQHKPQSLQKMAKTLYSVVTAFVLVFSLLISMTMAGRDLPKTDTKKPDVDVKHPENFFYYDRGYLIPGVGRGIKPKSKKGFNPFTYNPITGSNTGFPTISVPSIGGIGGTGNYVPGGDDTLVPNPGFEVPNPVGTGNTPVPTGP